MEGAAGAPARVRVESPTITTPLAGVPDAFRASHYMKVLAPVGGLVDALHGGAELRASENEIPHE